MHTYAVTAAREQGMWEIRIPELGSVQARVRRFTDIAIGARMAISMHLSVEPESFDVHVYVDIEESGRDSDITEVLRGRIESMSPERGADFRRRRTDKAPDESPSDAE